MSDSMTCCPLSGSGDGPTPKVSTSKRVRARRDYACCECRDPIAKGTVHQVETCLWDDRWYTMRTCLICVEIRNHFACGNGWVYEMLWEDLEDNFFSDMPAGGRCMDGLSPVAKGKLFERRLAWVLAKGPKR